MRIQFPVLTLLNRELRLESRHWRTYVFRIVMLAVIWIRIFDAEQASRFIGAPGKQFFASLMTLNMVLATLAGLSVFASAITEEKEEMTLGLMRMTSLNPVTILLGKSTAKMLVILFLLVAQMPFTLLAVTMGGVSTTQIAAAYVLLGTYVVFLTNAALFCSVVCRRTAWAIVMMVAILFVLYVLPAWVAALRPARMLMQSASGLSSQPEMLHPFWMWFFQSCSWWTKDGTAIAGMVTIFRSGFDGPVFGHPVMINMGLGAGFFLMSLLLFDLFTRNETESGPGRGLLARSRRGWRLFSPGRAWQHALLWKEFYYTNGGWFMMPIKLIAVVLLFGSMVLLIRRYEPTMFTMQGLGENLMGWAVAFASIDAVVYAARMFASERRWNTLSALVTLPISAQRLWYIKLQAGLPRFVPWALMFAAGAVLAPGSFWDAATDIIDEEGFYYAACVAAFFMHLLIWLSLKFRRWALLVAIIVMILIWIMAGIAASIDESCMRAFLILLGFLAVALHFLMPVEIAHAAANE